MRLVAYVDDRRHAYINVLVEFHEHPQLEIATFLVDTGCTTTCLLQDHVLLFGINYSELLDAPGSSTTAGGRITPKLLPNVNIHIPVKTGLFNRENSFVKIAYDELRVMPPDQEHIPRPRNRVFSLLGMDILRQFKKWRWRRDRLIMDT